MDFNSLLEQLKNHPAYEKVGMVLCHQGVVRATSRDGRAVRGLRVAVDERRLEQIIEEKKALPGVVEILVQINADRELKVGDDVMGLVVAGDIRENVIAALSETLNAIKTKATKKTEHFSE